MRFTFLVRFDQPVAAGADCDVVAFGSLAQCPHRGLLARHMGKGLEGGRVQTVNTDGGLIANGEPIGASGLRQIHELVLQLRGNAGDRQVPGNPRVGYGQLYGAPGTAGVSILTT